MLAKFRSGYVKLRSLPRYVVVSLDGIAAGIAGLRQQREAGFLHTAASLGDIHADITGFCDEATRLMLELKTATDAQSAQAAQSGRRLQALEAALAGLAGQLAAGQAREAARAQAAEAALRAALETALAGLAERLEAFREAPRGAPPPAPGLVARAAPQPAAIERPGAASAEQGRLFPSWMWQPEVAERVRAILARLAPQSVPGTAKLRVGRDRDGGYVMLDDFADIAGAVSGGIADDVSWDLDIAGRGIPVAQFDPSLAGPPAEHALFRFERLRLGAEDVEPDGDAGTGSARLDTVLATRMAHSDGPLLLKLDVEGDEWAVLAAVPDATLDRFRQLVCEFHGLERLGEPGFGAAADAVFAKLARSHFVHHVHGNNCADFANVGNVVVPQSLEVSFARRADYRCEPDPGLSFPTPFDRPNQPGRADLFLGGFRFGPPPPGA